MSPRPMKAVQKHTAPSQKSADENCLDRSSAAARSENQPNAGRDLADLLTISLGSQASSDEAHRPDEHLDEDRLSLKQPILVCMLTWFFTIAVALGSPTAWSPVLSVAVFMLIPATWLTGQYWRFRRH